MSIVKLIERLSADSLSPVYLLHGPERFFIDDVLRQIKKIVLSGPMAGLNLHELKGDDVSGEEIVSEARQIPMMASKSLVVVENAHKLSAADFENLDSYFGEPAPETCLVLVGDRFDKRRAAIKKADGRGWVFQAAPLKESEIIPFLKARARLRKVALSTEALAAVAAAIGPDSAALDDAVERLGLYVGEGGKVQEEDVAEVVSTVRQHSVFELVDAIGTGRAAAALTLLSGLLSRREEPIMINAMVARHVRQLLGARIHLHLGTDRRELAGLLGAPPFMVDKLLRQARRFRGAALEKALRRLAVADFELKSSKRPSPLVLEAAILDLADN